jgi:hypothetical protein
MLRPQILQFGPHRSQRGLIVSEENEIVYINLNL